MNQKILFKLFLLLFLVSCSSNLESQQVRLFQVNSTPNGGCQNWNLAQDISNGKLYYCKQGAWTEFGTGTGGGISNGGLVVNGLVYASGSNEIKSSGALTNGQLFIGSTGSTPVSTTLSTNLGISVTNSAGSITLSNTGILSISSGAGISVSAGQTPIIAATAVPSSSLNITPTTCVNQFVTAISSNAIGTCTTDTLASTFHSNQGTATTVLHGNASGSPAWGAIVSGDLSITATTCTNQFLRSLSSTAVGTCATVANTDLQNSSVTINGTTNQITVSGSPLSLGGTITISTPQNIHTGASVTFAALNLSGLGGTVQCLHVVTNGDITTTGSDCGAGGGGGGNVSTSATMTNRGAIFATGSSTIKSTAALTNGQLLIGSTGADPVAATLTGTSNQITITNGAGTITVATPQNIHSGASPTFTGLTLSGTGGSGTRCLHVDNSGVFGIASADCNVVTFIAPRISSNTSSATPTPNADSTDVYILTAQAAGATFGAPTGSPVQGQRLIIRIKDNATPQTLAWNAIYRASSDLSLPTTTTTSKTMYMTFIYNSTDTKWDFLSMLDNF